MERTILHCDCNSFFASVELLDHPHLRQVPVAVCGQPEEKRGVVLAKNDLAKAMGVITGESVYAALKKCPNLTLLQAHHAAYSAYSKKLNAIYESYTSQVEPFGIDESWLDVTDSLHLFGSGQEIADAIRERTRKHLGLTVSVGVSFNKTFAKLGSDYKKPDATTVISKANFKNILYPLPVEAMLYVGQSAASKLRRVGIRTIGDLAAASPETLSSLLGRHGVQLHNDVNGLDDTPVAKTTDQNESKSIGKGQTFSRDLTSMDEVRLQALWLADQVAAQLRQAGLKCQNVQVSIKNPQLKTITRQKMLSAPTALARDLYQTAIDLVAAHWSFRTSVRMLTLTAQQLCRSDEMPVQLSMFQSTADEYSDRQEKLEASMDQIRSRFGSSSVTFGRLVKESKKTDNPSSEKEITGD